MDTTKIKHVWYCLSLLLMIACTEEVPTDYLKDEFNKLTPMEQDNIMFGDSFDHFADSLKIPTGVELIYPTDLPFNPDIKRSDSILNLEEEENRLILFNSFQPGLFEYDYTFAPRANGTIFLKAYELTQELELSPDRLKDRSAIEVFKSDTVKVHRLLRNFTIYEGDWGKPYAARFEVWFENADGKSAKLTETNYIIEGWMR
jgi:hypothetical protein